MMIQDYGSKNNMDNTGIVQLIQYIFTPRHRGLLLDLVIFFFNLALISSLAACVQATPIPTSPSPALSTEPVTGSPTSQLAISTTTTEPTPLPLSSPTVTATAQPTATEAIGVLPTGTPGPTPTPIPTLENGRAITLVTLHMFDEHSGWGVESTGHIVRTKDGGSTWLDVTPPQGQYEAGSFYARDTNNVWAVPFIRGCYTENCSSLPKFMITWRTDDGGTTWQPSQPLCIDWDCGIDYDVPLEYFEPLVVQFLDENNGWMLVTVMHIMMQDRYRIYRTTDSGKTWKFVIDSLNGPMVFQATGLAFLDTQTGWFGTSQVGGASDPVADWSIYRTQDAGLTWVSMQLPPPPNLPSDFALHTVWCGVEQVKAIPPRLVDVSIYCEVYQDNTRPRYHFHYHSLDGGQTWLAWPSMGYESFVDGYLGWRFYSPDPSQPSQVQKTTDNGQSWVNVRFVDWKTAQFDFINEQTGWALVSDGRVTALVHTDDSGQKWTNLNPVASN